MGELLAWAHQGQQDGTVPFPSAPLVPGCFATGRRGASLQAAVPTQALPGAAHASNHIRCPFCRVDLCYHNQMALRGLRDRHFTRGGGTKGEALSCFARGICSLAGRLGSQIRSCSATPSAAPFAPTARDQGKVAGAVPCPSLGLACPCPRVACRCPRTRQAALHLCPSSAEM